MADRFFGLYRGVVVDDADPLAQMRIRVSIPQVLGEASTAWALPCVPPGTSAVPEVGTTVWIEFEAGDPSSPVWIGSMWESEAPEGKRTKEDGRSSAAIRRDQVRSRDVKRRA